MYAANNQEQDETGQLRKELGVCEPHTYISLYIDN
jgi:hypothetical protein